MGNMVIFIDTFRQFWEAQFQYTRVVPRAEIKNAIPDRWHWLRYTTKTFSLVLRIHFHLCFALMFLGWGS